MELGDKQLIEFYLMEIKGRYANGCGGITMSLDSDFGRVLLAQIIPDVRKHVPRVRLRDAWDSLDGSGMADGFTVVVALPVDERATLATGRVAASVKSAYWNGNRLTFRAGPCGCGPIRLNQGKPE